MGTLVQNLQYALRQLRRAPAFTLTVVLTLALGIGANTAVFTLFDQVLLRVLPVEQPGELVRFSWNGSFSGSISVFGGDQSNYFSYPMYRDLRDRSQVFNGMLATVETNVGVNWANQSENENAEVVSGNYFQVLGVQPALGRLFTQADDTEQNANPLVVLGYNYWQSRFAASPAILGQTVRINGHPFTVIGVAPSGFLSAIGDYKSGLFVPISMADVAIPSAAPRKNRTNRQSLWLTLVARLKPGVSAKEAQASLGPLWHALRIQELSLYTNVSQQFSQRFANSSLTVADNSRGFAPGRGDLKTPLVILISMSGLLVLMCVINVATLLLLRASARAREMSMRYALGAGRSRIVTQLLIEGVLLGVAGASLGLLLAPMLTSVLVKLLIQAAPGSIPYSASPDGRVLLFTLSISLAASLLFSIAPVLHFMRPDLMLTLRQNAGTSSKGSQRFRKIAVGAQILLSVMLLGGAGLFVHTLNSLSKQPVGFATDHLLTFGLDPTATGYDEEQTRNLVPRATEALKNIPGIVTVSATEDPELSHSNWLNSLLVQGHKATPGENISFENPHVLPGYFATLHQPLLAGRDFSAADTKGAPSVAIVNLAFAKKFYGSAGNALGRILGDHDPSNKKTFDITIVGVAGDVKHADLRTDIGPAVYQPFLQQAHPSGVVFYVRTAQSSEQTIAGIRQSIRHLDSSLVVDSPQTMQQQIASISSDERALAFLAMGFSGLALVLSAVGIYGVLAYSTEQRSREIGIRLALGEQRGSIVWVVVREMLVIAALATAVALPSTIALAQLFRSQLYGVTVADPLTLIAAVVVTAAMVAVSVAIPARRASSIDPIQALRVE